MSRIGQAIQIRSQLPRNVVKVCDMRCEHIIESFLIRTIGIVETREVTDEYLAGYGRTGTRTGSRAIDTDGNEWFQDWDGARHEGPGPWEPAADNPDRFVNDAPWREAPRHAGNLEREFETVDQWWDFVFANARHDHMTRDIKAPGRCLACDAYHHRQGIRW